MTDDDRPRDERDRPAEEGEGRWRGSRARLEALIPEMVKKAIAQGASALSDDKVRETLVAEIMRKAISKGGEVVDTTEDQLRRLVGELPVPKELVDRLGGKLDEYKGELFRVVRQEVHEFLEHVDLGAELQKMLTSLSFEITTEIRFIPNEKAVQGPGPAVKPDVKSGVRVKKASEPGRGKRSKRQTPEPGEGGGGGEA